MDIYDKLTNIIEVKKYRLSATLFSEENKQGLDTQDIAIFDLLKNIASLAFDISDDNVEISPYIVADKSRSFAIEDLSDTDYDLLLSLDLEKIPLNLKARIADILWIQKRDYSSAIAAAESYYDLFNLWFSDEDWLEALKMIKRAICMSAQLNRQDLYDKYCQTIYNHIIRIDGNDAGFLSISLIRILLVQSYKDLGGIISVIDHIIKNSQDNPYKAERAFELKADCLNKVKNKELAIQNNVDMADYFAYYGEKVLKNDIQGPLRAQLFFQKSINAYRNNGQPEKAEKLHKRLVEIQKDIPKLMKPFTTQFDIQGVLDNIKQSMTGFTFEESIIRLAQMVSFYKKDDFKKKILGELSFSQMFTSAFINSNGQTTYTLPGLDLSNPEKDPELLDKHIHHKMLEHEKIFGDIYGRNILAYIKDSFDIETVSLDFLLSNNFLIPEGRECVFRSAIIMALKGQYYEAIHILAPQTENIFRYIAREVGALTVTLETDGTSKEKVLSSIFDLPELIDSYDNDILFLFKGLLNEQAGANIRNEVAHGIIDLYSASSGASIYFICAVIKLLVISSRGCTELLLNDKEKFGLIVPLEKFDLNIKDKPTQ